MARPPPSCTPSPDGGDYMCMGTWHVKLADAWHWALSPPQNPTPQPHPPARTPTHLPLRSQRRPRHQGDPPFPAAPPPTIIPVPRQTRRQDAGVVEEVASGRVVARVHHQVVPPQEPRGGGGGEGLWDWCLWWKGGSWGKRAGSVRVTVGRPIHGKHERINQCQ